MEGILTKLWNDAPLVGFALFILFAGYMKWWVWGYQLTAAEKALIEMKAERDKWADVAWKGAESTRKAVNATEKVADALKVQP